MMHPVFTLFSPPSRLRAIVSTIAIGCCLAGPATGIEDLNGVAAVVNEHAISVLELDDRISIALAASGLQSTPEMRRQLVAPVLRSLIEEALQTQEAERQGVRITETELRDALREVESRSGADPGGLEAYLRSLNIPLGALEAQIRAQLVWSKFINRRLRPTLDISNEEVDEELARLRANTGRTEYLVSEIALYINDPARAGETRETASGLIDQLRAGANFAAIAQQFSQGSLASNGGDLGWVAGGQSRPEIDAALAEMAVGSYSSPIEAVGAVHILHLRDKRAIGGEQDDPRLRLIQVLLPSARADTRDRAVEIRDTVEGCEDMAQAAEAAEVSASANIGWVRLGDLPTALRAAVEDIEIGQPSEPIETGAGIHVLMVCERGDASGGEQQRDAIRERIVRERLEVMSRALLRNLQRSAFVDLRI